MKRAIEQLLIFNTVVMSNGRFLCPLLFDVAGVQVVEIAALTKINGELKMNKNQSVMILIC